MTDIDAMNKHVTRLISWKAEVQETLSRFKELSAQEATGGDTSSSETLSHRVDDLARQFEAQAAKLDQMANLQTLSASVEGRLESVSTDVNDFKAKFPEERVNALDFLLTWFQDNREGLEVLLSLGDETTEKAASGGNEPSSSTPSPGTVETPVAGATAATGEVAAQPGASVT
jgi:hypothetical protein